MLPKLVQHYKKYIETSNSNLSIKLKQADTRIKEIDKQIFNIVSVIANTASTSLSDKLIELESEKSNIEKNIRNLKSELNKAALNEETIKNNFKKAKELFKEGNLATNKKIVEKFVDKIIIFSDHIELYFNVGIKGHHQSDGDAPLFSDILNIKQSLSKIRDK